MAKNCNYIGCVAKQFGGGYCPRHQYLRTDKKPKVQQPRKPIAKRSKKLQERYTKEYVPKIAPFLAERSVCELKTPVCTYHATAVHHPRGRIGKRLTNTAEWMAACYSCNGWVEDNHEEAVKMGLKFIRNGKD